MLNFVDQYVKIGSDVFWCILRDGDQVVFPIPITTCICGIRYLYLNILKVRVLLKQFWMVDNVTKAILAPLNKVKRRVTVLKLHTPVVNFKTPFVIHATEPTGFFARSPRRTCHGSSCFQCLCFKQLTSVCELRTFARVR